MYQVPFFRRLLLKKLRDRYFTNWKRDGRRVCSRVLEQQAGICWAISVVRHFAALLKLAGRLDPNQELSIEELIHLIRRHLPEQLTANYGLRDLRVAELMLMEVGLVLESVNPLIYNFERPLIYNEVCF